MADCDDEDDDDDDTIGLSVGGAKDTNAFRQSIAQKRMPQLNAITFEGIFYDYYFTANKQKKRDEGKEPEQELFYPKYSMCFLCAFAHNHVDNGQLTRAARCRKRCAWPFRRRRTRSTPLT